MGSTIFECSFILLTFFSLYDILPQTLFQCRKKNQPSNKIKFAKKVVRILHKLNRNFVKIITKFEFGLRLHYAKMLTTPWNVMIKYAGNYFSKLYLNHEHEGSVRHLSFMMTSHIE